MTGMASRAFEAWNNARAVRLDRLEAAHVAFAGEGRGRRWETEELNHAIVLRLAAEFQGFCRDLHDECILILVRGMGLPAGRLEDIVLLEFSASRRLDSGNASPGGIGTDFARLGMTLWPDIKRHYAARGPQWNERLEILNTARNGIAHDDQAKLAEVRSRGWPLTLPGARRLRRSLDGLAKGMDTVCRDHLASLLKMAPW